MLARAIYFSLKLTVVFSFFLLLLFITGILSDIWTWFYIFYITLAVCHTWYLYILLAKEDLIKRNYPAYEGEEVAVVMPCYNEEPEFLKRSIDSILAARGNKGLIIVNDGSTNGIESTLALYKDHPLVAIHTFEKNQGKRAGLYSGIYEISGDTEFIITTDSDTIFDKNAIVRIVEGLKLKNVGAVSGYVQVMNEKKNMLTRMTAAYYWAALNMTRKAQSALGQVACCSGALSGYRGEIVRPLMNDFINEEFLGEKSTYGEDRHLTNLVLKQGWDVIYREDAIAYTESPEQLRIFMKQQLRWRRGFFREAIFALPFMWRVKPFLFFEIVVWELFLPLISVSLILLLFVNGIFDPIFALLVLLPSFLGLAVVRHLPLILFSPDKLVGLILFSFFSQFVLFFQTFHALFTLKDNKWITR